MSSPQLDYKSTVCFVPPRGQWSLPIQEIRCFNDKGFVRWPPHVNLLYPFWSDIGDDLKKAAIQLRRSLKPFQPFSLDFKNFRFFNHGNTCTVWLEPESESLKALQETLVQAFPECQHLSQDTSLGIDEFIPHLSVGQWPTQQLAEEAITRLSLQWKPIRVPFDHIMILHRRAHQTPFEFRYKIPLGSRSDEDIEEVNTSYVASLGSTEQSCNRHPYGMGSYAQGVWNFAYGANVNHHKLVNVRQITPLESLPGCLEGYRLTFNHDGAMGNVELMSRAAVSYFEARGITGVHGILHRLSVTDFARLTNMESGYRPVELDVLASDGRGRIKTVTFVSPRDRSVRDDLPPTVRYHNLILTGARRWNLSAAYIRWLESLETIPASKRGPLYWRTPEGHRIPGRIMRVGADPPSRNPSTR